MRLWCLFCLFLLPVNAFAADYAQVQVVPTKVGEAWLVEDHSLPVFSLQIAFEHAGSAFDPQDKKGRAWMTANMLDQGAGRLDALAFQRALEEHAIDFSADVDRDALTINLHSLSENRARAFELLSLALTQPQFDKAVFKRRKQQGIARLRRMSESPAYVLMQTMLKEAYAEHPYAYTEYGSEQTLQHLSAEDLHQYHRHFFTQDNIIISAAGDITPAELIALLESALSPLSEDFDPTEKIETAHIQKQGQNIHVERDIPQTLVSFITPGYARKDEQFMAAYVVNQLLGGNTLTSVFGEEIREKRGLAYYFNSVLNPARYSPEWGGQFATRTDQVGAAIATLKETAKDLYEHGVDPKKLEDTKAYIMGSFVLSLDSNNELVAFLTNLQRNDLGSDYFERRNELVKAVTKEQADAVMRELLNPEEWLIVTVGKSPEGAKP